MCRNIKPLFNLEPPATHDEIRDAALRFVREVSGAARPSKKDEAAFRRVMDEIAATVHELLYTMETTHQPRNREAEAAPARAKSVAGFATRAVARGFRQGATPVALCRLAVTRLMLQRGMGKR